ncbi:RNA polymerase sigma factor [Allopusillimonas ginsengisoli]|uniref:RNA polymerase sigma factor n=1 Tax=Allopusillimonas ginsengisoli TaxID=453575 RepID=UPI00101FA9C0|nr:RNA polymerase sigma factor [Allopusillimonas ginsengisoli]TEA80018.1 RNA polymerase sigma factor [Allopusillimonas ginsengisoli]
MWTPQLLFQKHAHEINCYLRKCGHGQDEAADLTQDVFLRVMRAMQPKCDDNLRAYLYAVARNLSTDVYRRRQTARISDIPDYEYYGFPDPNPGPEQVIACRQQLEILDRALAELPQKTRRAFELYRFGEMTITQVAAEINLSVSRTWTIIQQACQHLRASIQEEAS